MIILSYYSQMSAIIIQLYVKLQLTIHIQLCRNNSKLKHTKLESQAVESTCSYHAGSAIEPMQTVKRKLTVTLTF